MRTHREDSTGTRLRWPRAAAGWTGLAVVWLIVAGRASPGEWIAAACAVPLAVILLRRAARGEAVLTVAPIGRLVRASVPLVRQSVVDTFIVGGALWRAVRGGGRAAGAFRRVPLPRHPPEVDPRGYRGAVVSAASLAPNRFVVSVDTDRETLLTHHLVAPAPDAPAIPDPLRR